MDNDFPLQMAGGALGLQPLDLREGLKKWSMRNEYDKMRFANMIPPLSAMAPEGAAVEHALTGGYQPEVAFGL